MGEWEEGRREEGGWVTRRLIHSVPVGFGSGIGLFFALVGWMDGLLEALVWFVWLVWSGLAGLAGCILPVGGTSGVTTRSVLSVCSFVSCCMLYTVLVLSCLCAFDVNLLLETLS